MVYQAHIHCKNNFQMMLKLKVITKIVKVQLCAIELRSLFCKKKNRHGTFVFAPAEVQIATVTVYTFPDSALCNCCRIFTAHFKFWFAPLNINAKLAFQHLL